jgi:lipopolysaccharide kinase (Kdo/WaaP) family protein
MQKIQINNWTWFIENTALLHGWFERWKEFARDSVVKENPVRIVFKVEDLFYVKLERPDDFWRKLRNFFSPKAAREFATGRALEASGVPVVKHLGWAKCGSSNMLLTEAMPDSSSVHDYWHNEIVYGNVSKKKFLDNFAEFLKIFFASGFYHPDFHLGNILYSPTTESFALVDVYGMSRPHELSEHQINEHTRIFLELYRGLSDSEAVDLLMNVRNDLTLGHVKSFWEAGLAAKAVRAEKTWTKRQAQIENNYSKFVEVLNISDNDFLVRKVLGVTPAVSLDKIPDCLNGNYFNIIRLPYSEAEKIWLESFRLELLGVDHLRPLVFEKPGVLYFEKAPDGAPIAPQEKAEEFIARAQTAGVEVDAGSLLQLSNGRIALSKI